MPDFITLSCPSCGGKLEITKDLERFACGHCGTEHIVRRTPSTISLAPVTEVLEKVRDNTDRTAAELAIPRLKKEIAAFERKRLAEVAGFNAGEAVTTAAKTGAVASAKAAGKLLSLLIAVVAGLVAIFIVVAIVDNAVETSHLSIGAVIIALITISGCVFFIYLASTASKAVDTTPPVRVQGISEEKKKQHQDRLAVIDRELEEKRSQLEQSMKVVSGK